MSTVPTDIADTPTIGAWRRAHNHTQWSDDARHLYAVTACNEALRFVIADRLESIQRFLAVGATPDQAIAQLADLVASYHRVMHP